jgi:hypothetical protein
MFITYGVISSSWKMSCSETVSEIAADGTLPQPIFVFTESIALINAFQNGSFGGIAFIKWNHDFSHVTPSTFLSTTNLDFGTAATVDCNSDLDLDPDPDPDSDGGPDIDADIDFDA